MKHSDSLTAHLAELCELQGLDVSFGVLTTLSTYLEAVLVANGTVNLTRITVPAEALRLHLLDSLSALPEVLQSPAGRICDIGTGAGFPGVPLAFASDRSCTLLDSVGKKAEVVAAILSNLGIDDSFAVSRDRAEHHARLHAGVYSVCTARAVAPLASLVELSAPLLIHGGHLVALKGAPVEAELEAGHAAAKVAGLEFRGRRDFILAGGDEQRCVIVYEKVRKSRVALPRREGLAQHSPLG